MIMFLDGWYSIFFIDQVHKTQFESYFQTGLKQPWTLATLARRLCFRRFLTIRLESSHDKEIQAALIITSFPFLRNS